MNKYFKIKHISSIVNIVILVFIYSFGKLEHWSSKSMKFIIIILFVQLGFLIFTILKKDTSKK